MICLVGAPAFAGEIDVLKEQLQALQKKVEQIETTQNKRLIHRGKAKVQLEVSGQVNRALLFADNGDHSQLFNVDNDNSGTRVRWKAKARLNDDISAGALIEVQIESNSTVDVDMGQDSSSTKDNSFTERHMMFFIDSKKMGRVTLGQTATASDGTSEVDLSRTTVVANGSQIQSLAGGICFDSGALKGGPCGATPGPEIKAVYSNFDGLGREDLIKYDSPTIAGFKVSAGYIETDTYDVALRYKANYEAVGAKVSAAIAYENTDAKDSSTSDHQLNGSISLLHSSGFSITYATGRRFKGEEAHDADFWFIKGGWQSSNLTGLGLTALAFDYGEGDDIDLTDDEFSTWGVALVQNIDKLAMEIYFGFRNHDLDRPGKDFDDIDAALLGARMKF